MSTAAPKKIREPGHLPAKVVERVMRKEFDGTKPRVRINSTDKTMRSICEKLVMDMMSDLIDVRMMHLSSSNRGGGDGDDGGERKIRLGLKDFETVRRLYANRFRRYVAPQAVPDEERKNFRRPLTALEKKAKRQAEHEKRKKRKSMIYKLGVEAYKNFVEKEKKKSTRRKAVVKKEPVSE